ncbi:MAG: 4Fe-4S binding protein [Methanobacteriaceae archaeon]|nr:4Fe-4S binding protein [Methanobacteriaceae archaeon]
MRIYILSSGKYGSRVVNNLAEHGMASNIVGMEEFKEDIPLFLDDFSGYIPKNLPPSDLILAVGLSGDLNMIVPEVARKTGAKSAIIPIYGPKQMPPALQQEIIDSAPDIKIVFPKPFCSLEPVGDAPIDEFASRFGKPVLFIKSDKFIKKAEVLRGAPCGSTNYIARGLWSMPVQDAEFEATQKLHNYPCNASTDTDPAVGDTSMHLASYQIKEAIKRALGFAVKSAVVNPELCDTSQCQEQCIKVCPQVLIGLNTITLKEDKALIDPATCGYCEICVRECPLNAIEIKKGRFELGKD